MARGGKIMMLSGRNDNLDKYLSAGTHLTRLARELLQQWHSILFNNNIMNFAKYTIIYLYRKKYRKIVVMFLHYDFENTLDDNFFE